MFKKVFFFILALTCIQPSWAHYVAGQIWQANGTTYILLGEHHKNNKDNIQQIEDIITWGKRLNAHIIVEDGLDTSLNQVTESDFSYQQQTEYLPFLRLLFCLNKGSALIGFSSLCHHAGISVENIEYRFVNNLAASKFYDYLLQLVTIIKSFNDSDRANHVYQTEVNEFETLLKDAPVIFNLMKNEHTLSFEQFLEKYNKSLGFNELNEYGITFQQATSIENDLNRVYNYYLRKPRLNQYFEPIDRSCFDARLFNSFVLHAIENNKNPIKIICTGDAHRRWLANIFEQWKYLDKGEYFGDIIVSQSCLEHSPIDINQFFSSHFPNHINTHISKNNAESIISAHKQLHNYGLINKATEFGASAGLPVLTATIAAYIAGRFTPNCTIAGRSIPLRFFTGLGIWGTVFTATTLYLLEPRPINK